MFSPFLCRVFPSSTAYRPRRPAEAAPCGASRPPGGAGPRSRGRQLLRAGLGPAPFTPQNVANVSAVGFVHCSGAGWFTVGTVVSSPHGRTERVFYLRVAHLRGKGPASAWRKTVKARLPKPLSFTFGKQLLRQSLSNINFKSCVSKLLPSFS